MLDITVDHLLNDVLPAAGDYEEAENVLTAAFSADQQPAAWAKEASEAKRRASQLAVAIDGLADRAALELSVKLDEARHCKGGRGSPGHLARIRRGGTGRP